MYGSPETLVLRYKRSLQKFRWDNPQRRRQYAGEVNKIVFYDRSKESLAQKSYSENLCLSATVVGVLDGALAELRGVINNTGGSRRWFPVP